MPARWRILLVAVFTLVAGTTPTARLRAQETQRQSDAPERHVVRDGNAQMTVSVDPATSTVATTITLTIELQTPNSASVFPPNIGEKLGKFDVVDRQKTAPIAVGKESDLRLRRYIYRLESLSAGLLTIPPLVAAYQTPGMTSGPRSLTSGPIKIKIESMIAEDADPMAFRDLKPVQTSVPESRKPYGLAWSVVAVVALVAIAAVAVWKRHSRRRLSVSRWATKQIDVIDLQLRDGSIKAIDACQSLLSVMRRFIEVDQDVAAMAMSSRELIAVTEKVGWPDAAVDALRDLLADVEAWKFANNSTVDAASVRRYFQPMRDVIKRTSQTTRPPQPVTHGRAR